MTTSPGSTGLSKGAKLDLNELIDALAIRIQLMPNKHECICYVTQRLCETAVHEPPKPGETIDHHPV